MESALLLFVAGTAYRGSRFTNIGDGCAPRGSLCVAAAVDEADNLAVEDGFRG